MKKKIRSAWRHVRGKGSRFAPDAGLFFGQGLPRQQDQIVGINIEPYGRMGNNLLQIANAVLLARALDLRFVRLPPMELVALPEPVTVGDLTLLPANHTLSGLGGFVSSGFFVGARLERMGVTMERRRIALQKYIQPHLTVPIAAPETEGCLSIHLRSGDVFGPNPHASYAQPPLAFYLNVIDDARKRLAIDRVRLVYEDRQNPCVDALETSVREAGLSLEAQSGTFLGDVSTLLSARHLVFGYGTFGLGICLLSNAAESVYCFGGCGHPYSQLPSIKYLRVLDDLSGDYPRIGNWKASNEQRAIMLSLPKSAVGRIDETKPTDDAKHAWWTLLDDEI